MALKVIIVGGVAGGATAAARLRRIDEEAEIIIVEKGDYISYANCGLPYHIGGVIPGNQRSTGTDPRKHVEAVPHQGSAPIGSPPHHS